jgi:hypothetical protein
LYRLQAECVDDTRWEKDSASNPISHELTDGGKKPGFLRELRPNRCTLREINHQKQGF